MNYSSHISRNKLIANSWIICDKILTFTFSSLIFVIIIIIITDGVLVAKKDYEIEHDEITTKNLYVIKAMQSLTSKGFVKTQFSWQYYYYTLTDEGLDFLREFLGVPEGIVPQTLMEQPIPQRQHPERRQGGRRFDGENGYRKRNRD